MSTIAELLRASGLAAVDARVLLRYALDVDDVYLIAHAGDTVDEPLATKFRALVARRAAGEPVAYITGEREFYGHAFTVSPAVLIPRPETELLVELALERLSRDASGTVLDLGTGSGCIAISIALARPAARVIACDRSAAALAVARENAARLNTRNVVLLASDWFAALHERFDVIVANPPYVAIGDVHLTWENEAHLEVTEAKGELELVFPEVSILAEPHVAVVDSVADKKGTRATAEEYLKFLSTKEGQEVIAKHFHRPSNAEVLAASAASFPAVELFPVTKIAASWDDAQAKFFEDGAEFDKIYIGEK